MLRECRCRKCLRQKSNYDVHAFGDTLYFIEFPNIPRHLAPPLLLHGLKVAKPQQPPVEYQQNYAIFSDAEMI